MTRRRKLELHRHGLAEIRDIMNSMQTLAYIETRKLARFLDAQHAVVQNIKDVAADLLSFYPEILPEATEATPVYVLIGTERGFCGDFNHALLKGEAPEAFIVNVPFHLRKKMSEIAEDRAISAVFAAGDFVEASVKGVKRGDAVFAMIKTDAGWYGLYGERSPFRLGQDPLDLRAVWAGSADMLASAIRYIQANPFRAEIPVRAGVEWARISKVAEGLVDVNALQPVALADVVLVNQAGILPAIFQKNIGHKTLISRLYQ